MRIKTSIIFPGLAVAMIICAALLPATNILAGTEKQTNTSAAKNSLGAPPGAGASPLGPNVTAGRIPVLLVKGMWSQHWNLNEALASPAGEYGITNSYVTQRYNYVFALKYFPKTREELMREKVVVLGNVPTTAFSREGKWNGMKPVQGRSDQWLVDFVAQGGGLFVLGGSFSFDLENTTRNPGKTPVQNTFKDSALAKVLPVELDEKGMRIEDQNQPIELEPAGTHPILNSLDFADKPITLFFHPMKPRKDAVVIVTAQGAPILILGTYGKGRVAVFLATLHGDPGEDVLPYWKWKSWPVLIRNVVKWLATE